MAEQGQPEGTHLHLAKYSMVDAGVNGIREKGCQHLSKLESKIMEEIDL